MDPVSPLAQFLRARRAMVEPEDVGLPRSASARRVTGLRREEVALIAGISSDYYLRLEQGREQHPSAVVLQGLTRALALDADGVAHLHRLNRPPIERPASVDEVSASLLGLIDSMPSIPAHVLNRYLDIIHVNRLAELLNPWFRLGNNLIEIVFHPDVERDAHWRLTARRAVAFLRASVDPHDDGPRISALLAHLHATDPDFSALWNLHEARTPAGHPLTFSHPTVGLVELRYQNFDLPGTGGQTLGMYVPAPGGVSAEKLQRLSLLAYGPEPQTDRGAPRKIRDTPAR